MSTEARISENGFFTMKSRKIPISPQRPATVIIIDFKYLIGEFGGQRSAGGNQKSRNLWTESFRNVHGCSAIHCVAAFALLAMYCNSPILMSLSRSCLEEKGWEGMRNELASLAVIAAGDLPFDEGLFPIASSRPQLLRINTNPPRMR